MALNRYGEECVESHVALIYDRGGVTRLSQLTDLGEVTWGRVRSDLSEAEVIINGRACSRQADVLRRIESKRHELVLYRGGVRCWEGSIQQVAWYANRVVISAHDPSAYLRGTVLSKDWPNSDGGGPTLMTERMEQIVVHELSQPYEMQTNDGLVEVPRWENIDPPANLLPFLDVRPGNVLTRSSTLAFEMTVQEHLDNLAESGVDYTWVGRSMIVWDADTPLGRTRTLTDADFYGELEVYESGTRLAQVSHISGQRPDPDEVIVDPVPGDAPAGVGNAGGADDYYGPWTTLTTQANEDGDDQPTQTELNTQAQRNLGGRTIVPVDVIVPQGAGIRLGVGLGINDLVPGVEVPVLASLNLRPVQQTMVLDKMSVHESADGETISVDLTATGTAGDAP